MSATESSRMLTIIIAAEDRVLLPGSSSNDFYTSTKEGHKRPKCTNYRWCWGYWQGAGRQVFTM